MFPNRQAVFLFVRGESMAVCEKTVAELPVIEICTKYLFISEPGNRIFKAYGSGGIFCLLFKILPLGYYRSQ